jgi:hypothetical protein
MSYQKYIEMRAEKRFGQPCIINTRITVFDILSSLASGMTVMEIIGSLIVNFPEKGFISIYRQQTEDIAASRIK